MTAMVVAVGLPACHLRASSRSEPTVAKASLASAPLRANFEGVRASSDMHALVDGVLATRDNGNRPFAVVDKRQASLYVFAADGHLIGASPVLIGYAPGDETEPGIGSKAIADIRPQERTTPAGRFVTMPGINAHGKPVVWIDYGAAVSMHAVVTDVPSERRLERLASPDPAEALARREAATTPASAQAG